LNVKIQIVLFSIQQNLIDLFCFTGRMVRALESFGIVPLQFRLDSKRPDLSKLDSLLGLLSAECNFFSLQANTVSEARKGGKELNHLLALIRDGPGERDDELLIIICIFFCTIFWLLFCKC
jgi:hypothetical protein